MAQATITKQAFGQLPVVQECRGWGFAVYPHVRETGGMCRDDEFCVYHERLKFLQDEGEDLSAFGFYVPARTHPC
jgi:hypothetical protein